MVTVALEELTSLEILNSEFDGLYQGLIEYID
jgi:hypothetical protein